MKNIKSQYYNKLKMNFVKYKSFIFLPKRFDFYVKMHIIVVYINTYIICSTKYIGLLSQRS